MSIGLAVHNYLSQLIQYTCKPRYIHMYMRTACDFSRNKYVVVTKGVVCIRNYSMFHNDRKYSSRACYNFQNVSMYHSAAFC